MISRKTYDLIPVSQVRDLDGDNLGSVDGANHNAGCPGSRHVSAWRHYRRTNQRCNLYKTAISDGERASPTSSRKSVRMSLSVEAFEKRAEERHAELLGEIRKENDEKRNLREVIERLVENF